MIASMVLSSRPKVPDSAWADHEITPKELEPHERPPDWRWQRAGELLERGLPLRRDRDHSGISEIKHFRRLLDMAQGYHLVLRY